MASFALVTPDRMPVHVLFPEQYEASKRTIAKDFVFFGIAIAGTIVLAAMVHLVVA